MNKITHTKYNESLLKKASAVKIGWLAMDTSGNWNWFSKRPYWVSSGFWWNNGFCTISTAKFLKLPKRCHDFAKQSLIKCSKNGPILLAGSNLEDKPDGR